MASVRDPAHDSVMGARRNPLRLHVAASIGIAALSLAGCTSGDSTTSETASTSTAKTEPSSAVGSSTPPDCPNPEGGSCLDKLEPRTPYTTQVFTPQLTYQVPTKNWFNYEDTPGNFLLVPPGNDLPGVNAGTSDFIGVYTAVVPARITDPNSCSFQAVPGNWSPRSMATYFQHRQNLDASDAVPIAIGGLRGVLIDLRIKPGTKLDVCHVNGETLELGGEFTGVPPSSLDHAVIEGMTMRMIMLGSAGNVLLVEVDDIDDAPVGLRALTAVARHLQFGS